LLPENEAAEAAPLIHTQISAFFPIPEPPAQDAGLPWFARSPGSVGRNLERHARAYRSRF